MITIILISFVNYAFLIQPTGSFYIPGVAPLDFQKGEEVDVKVIISTLFLCVKTKHLHRIYSGCENDKYENAITVRLLRYRRSL